MSIINGFFYLYEKIKKQFSAEFKLRILTFLQSN